MILCEIVAAVYHCKMIVALSDEQSYHSPSSIYGWLQQRSLSISMLLTTKIGNAFSVENNFTNSKTSFTLFIPQPFTTHEKYIEQHLNKK